MKSSPITLSTLVALCTVTCWPALSAAETAPDLVSRSGVKGGLIVHVGAGGDEFTAALRINDRYVVQGLKSDRAGLAKAGSYLLARKISGPLSVIQWDGKRLPYADNLVSLLIVESAGDLADAEIMRALSPNGVVMVKSSDGWKKRTKPRPAEIDEWTHYLHGPDNNAVAEDTLVAPPRHMQWVSGPRWGRSHDHLSGVSAVVSAGGRIFSIVDEGTIASVKEASSWMLVARDAFNGVLLWKKPVSPWEDQLRPFRSGPAELPRRLVAVGDRVYATLGYNKPVVAMDAATGEILHTYKGTDNAHEIVCSDGKLFVVISRPLKDPSPTTGRVLRKMPLWRGAYGEYAIQYMSKRIEVFDAKSGKVIWKKDDRDTAEILPLSLIVGQGRAFFQNGTHLVALKASTGREQWKTKRPSPRQRYAWGVPTVVLKDGVVLSADRAAEKPVDTGAEDKGAMEWQVSANHLLTGGLIVAFDAADGKELWTAPCHEGFNSPADLFVIGGKVYSGPLAWGRQPGITNVYDLKTGKVATTKPPDQKLYTFGFGHHRCHRNKATTKYIIQARAGIEFLDVSKLSRATADHWVRGACQYGTLPCNGLMYAPTHPCACYITAKLDGYNALSGKRTVPFRKGPEQLVKGAAFGKIPQAEIRKSQLDWPTLRGDNARGGSTRGKLSTKLKCQWETSLPGPLTAVVVAGGKLYVARREANTVCALNADDGKLLWSFTAGGRVDSPPTVFGEAVYFGSADGWIYCLRAGDGALAWRFRVAPEARQIVAYGRLESVWPVHGNVLVCKGPKGTPVAYAAAGRTSYVDGGVYLCGVEAPSGKLLFRRTISHMDPKTGNEPQSVIKGVIMPGAIPDVLSTDGTSIFMRHQRFDLEGNTLGQNVDHLFCSAGFLDETWWHRTYLQIGQFMRGGYGGWTSAGNSRISGKALVTDNKRAYGFGRTAYSITGNHLGINSEFRLFAADRKTGAPPKPQPGKNRRRRVKSKVNYVWSKSIGIYPRAMLLAGETLFLAGPSNVNDFFAGAPAADVLLLAVSTEDGAKTSEIKLKASPVYDSFAACNGRLYFATVDDRVTCWK